MDILVLIVFLLSYAVCAILILLVHYYYRILFPGKGEYKRDEIVDIKSNLKQELNAIYPEKDRGQEYLALTIGSIIGFILSYTGGIYGENYESYVFHSAILPVLAYFGLGFIKKEGMEDELPSPVKNLLKQDFSLFMGFTLSILAKTVMIYGIYHVVSFLWIFPNIVLMIMALVNRIIEKHKKSDYNLFFKHKSTDN